MKCPMLTMYAISLKPPEDIQDRDCLKEECAWWDKDKDICFRASETLELRFIRSIFLEIRDKMPKST